jgi:hypothetical protein
MRGYLLLLFLVGLAVVGTSAQPTPAGDWIEVEGTNLDVRALTARGEQVLAFRDFSWKHAQTPHFVIHYEQAIFARKVARMAEFFHATIAQDLHSACDQAEGRSHIFIFRSARRWDDFRRADGAVPEWTSSQVEGPVLFLQQADNLSSSGTVLAHEMTHLVMNRLLSGRAPLWLDEGLAEYYGEFGFSEFKGAKRSKRPVFSKLADPYPLKALLHASSYPVDGGQVQAFYETSKYLVAFLLLERPAASFLPFMADLMAGVDAPAAFSTHYGFASLEDLDKEFRRFAF